MPKGPDGHCRPVNVIGNAVHNTKIVTREIEDTALKQSAKRASDLAGVQACSKETIPQERSEIARLAAENLWKQ